ncbi:HAD-IA family hydrolase [Vreelandella titanicae]|jgi:phosphoglycolate phosphatase|uniref:HAD family hydrolase n=1 Tax=Halomonadaceae TaxID=28256 RepID=UPI0003494591|nr:MULTISPECIES: HAD-IA family hydrolase [Halomonas]NAO97326.1 HAD-IA family hydrolase [Halomonas sp. MG34]QGQ70213.1 HAD family hydrolase [Halomonas sp. PA16-9]KIN16633.1 HAD family hydrolase [Halomonas sp. KHS3]NVE89515.1 HAD-IA family hydrolase [Halomonas titanicae]PKH58927.1 HAD family hydrolase [Halomonas sp. Choline-3u-9]
MQYELIIFDWDGTLMDSVPRIVSCMQAAALEAEWGALSAAEVEDIIGLGLPEAIAKLCPGILPAQAERLRERYAHHFVQADTTPMAFFSGVEAHIARLRGHEQQRLAVATGKSRRGLDRIFTETGSGAWFHASRTADETRSKPHPQMLSELLAELAVPVERAVMVGDTEYDMEMARAMGMDRVGVSYGVHAPERLAMSEPKWIAHSVDELFDRL